MIRLDRLRALADHLERGKLGHELFVFSIYNFPHEPKCGAVGCAVGEFPVLWPEFWRFDRLGDPMPREVPDEVDDPPDAAAWWLGISVRAALHLFVAKYQHPEDYGGQVLCADSTREEVAANIRSLIALAENGLLPADEDEAPL